MRFRVALIVALIAAAPAVADENGLMARVDGDVITAGDVEIASRLLGDMDPKDADANRRQIVDALVEVRLMAKAALADKLDSDPAFLAEMKFLRERALRALYIRKTLEKTVTDELVQAAYEKQVASITPTNEIRIRHILVSTQSDADRLINDIKQGQKSFEDEAKTSSQDESSGANGGDLGFLTEDQVPPEFVKAVSGAAPGEVIASPVQTPFGFHVLKFEGQRAKPTPTLEQSSPEIRHSLEASVARELVSSLRAKAKIEVVGDGASQSEAESGSK